MRKLGSLLLTGVLLMAALPAAAESSVKDDPFAAVHARLEEAISNSVTPPQVESGVEEAKRAQIADPEAAAIRAFALRYWNADERSLARALGRVAQLQTSVGTILREEGLAPEMIALMLVESAGRADALSPAGARGLWQFMPETARRYGLQVSAERDERLHVEKSTRAAARHLRDLRAQFGSWELAFAAYNAGAARVSSALARAESPEFAVAAGHLPAETRNYVPAVMAAMRLLGGKAQTFSTPEPRRGSLVFASLK